MYAYLYTPRCAYNKSEIAHNEGFKGTLRRMTLIEAHHHPGVDVIDHIGDVDVVVCTADAASCVIDLFIKRWNGRQRIERVLV